MRKISEKLIVDRIYKAIEKANFSLEARIKKLICDARKKEKNPYGRKVLDVIIENIKIASKEKIPLCQDTGMVVLFFEIGSKTMIEFKEFHSLQNIVDCAVKDAYNKLYLRKSVVSMPDRINTKTNAPAVVWCESVPGDEIKFSLIIKGFGSENTTKLKMFLPGIEQDEIIQFIVDCTKKAGANPCPPIFIGIGMGGTAEKAIYLSKKALLDVGNKKYSEFSKFEEKIISKVNETGIGPGGLGGRFTCLDAKIKAYPTHIAGFPVAVSISCWAHRMHQETI